MTKEQLQSLQPFYGNSFCHNNTRVTVGQLVKRIQELEAEVERLRFEIADRDECESDIEQDWHKLNAYLLNAVGLNDCHSAYEMVDRLVSTAKDLQSEVQRLKADHIETDGTDVAHPSWWRGNDAAYYAMCEQLRKILDDEDDCSGKCQEPWDALRRRVLAMRERLANAKTLWAAEELERMADRAIGLSREERHQALSVAALLRRAAELRKGMK